MKILITPKDLIERCLWTDYSNYILRNISTDDKNKMIKENLEINLDEKDAYVIGLLAVVYTDHLIFKMNNFLNQILEHKSFGGKKKKMTDNDNDLNNENNDDETDEVVDKNQRFISKDTLLQNIDDFIKEFPESYQPDEHWKYQLKEVEKYSKELMSKVNKLKTISIQNCPCVKIKDVKSLYYHKID